MRMRTLCRELAVLLCALTATWPLSQLVLGGVPVTERLVVIGATVLVGAACRLRPLPGLLTLVLQLAGLAVTLAALLSARGISTAPEHVRELATTLSQTVHTTTAPLPDHPEVVAALLAGVGFVTLAVDYVAATARMCVFVALPMLAPFVLASAAIGTSLPTRYFVAAACAWALLLWSDTALSDGPGRPSLVGLALPTAVVCLGLIAALALSPLLPVHATPTMARAQSDGIDATVDFSRTLDLRKNLRSTNGAPVLEYTTTSPTPVPLRVTTSSTYTDGQWRAESVDGPSLEGRQETALDTVGLASATPTRSFHTSVTRNGLQDPLVAAPTPLIAANFGPGNETFRLLPDSAVPVLRRHPDSYAVLSRDFTASARPTSNRRVLPGTSGVSAADVDTSHLPIAARERLTRLLHDAGTTNSRFDQAVAIQRFLRSEGGFTYSLQAPTSGNRSASDPISAFLDEKKGYCTQFATAMVMAARVSGIPARVAIGFLPGTSNAGHFTVHASDAHAWPELFFPGMGWTRFDPTPPSRSGAAPVYAPDPRAASGSSPRSTPRATPKASTPRPITPTPTPSPRSSPIPHPTALSEHHAQNWITRAVWSFSAAAVATLALWLLPLAGRAERRRRLRRATGPEDGAEAQWHETQWVLADLRTPLPEGLSPRATFTAFLATYPQASPQLKAAMERACTSLETSRYGTRHENDPSSAMTQVQHVAWREASRTQRFLATLAPRSGVAYLRRVLVRFRH